jgi:nickel transport system substrate-binding protein
MIVRTTGTYGGQISLDSFDRFTKMPDYVTQVSQPLASRVVAINSKRGPTADLIVRQAIQHAVNKEALVKAIFYGVEQKADTLYSTDTPYCDLGLKPYVFDRLLAEKLFDEAGWKQSAVGEIRRKDGQELTIDFCFVGNDAQQKSIAEAIQGDLKKIGIKINMIGAWSAHSWSMS